jgi:hypothetical protein
MDIIKLLYNKLNLFISDILYDNIYQYDNKTIKITPSTCQECSRTHNDGTNIWITKPCKVVKIYKPIRIKHISIIGYKLINTNFYTENLNSMSDNTLAKRAIGVYEWNKNYDGEVW